MEIYASGWHPPEIPGPTHPDLVAAISDLSASQLAIAS